MKFTLEAGREWGALVTDLDAVGASLKDTSRLAADLGAQQVRAINGRVMHGGIGVNGSAYPKAKKESTYGGTTLIGAGRGGHMMANLGITQREPGSVTVGFSSANEMKKALWAQEGTKPHRITAKNGKSLAWKSYMGRTKGGRMKSNMAFAAFVNHPGTPPRPFFGISESEKNSLTAYVAQWRDKLLAARRL